MKPPADVNENPVFKYDFIVRSYADLYEFIKERMKDKLGLIESPTETQLAEIINKKPKVKGKTVSFRDFINKLLNEDIDFSDSKILDAEILEEPIRIKLNNKF